jgi:hypothetical protein
MSCPIPATRLSRREWLARLGRAMLISPLLNIAWLNMAIISTSCGRSGSSNSGPPPPTDDQFLDEIERSIFLYFWEQASSTTGQVKDRAFAGGNDSRAVSSIAATGFGLTALCIADQRGYMASASVVARVQVTFEFPSQPDAESKRFFLPLRGYEYRAEGKLRGFFD